MKRYDFDIRTLLTTASQLTILFLLKTAHNLTASVLLPASVLSFLVSSSLGAWRRPVGCGRAFRWRAGANNALSDRRRLVWLRVTRERRYNEERGCLYLLH